MQRLDLLDRGGSALGALLYRNDRFFGRSLDSPHRRAYAGMGLRIIDRGHFTGMADRFRWATRLLVAGGALSALNGAAHFALPFV